MTRKIVAEQRIEARSEKPEGSESTTKTLYAIEVRSSVGDPLSCNGVLYGHAWKRVRAVRAPLGIPDVPWNLWANEKGYYSYDTAFALAACVRAEANVQLLIGLQVRLVEFEASWTCTFTKLAEFEPMYWRGRPKYEDDTDE